MLSPEGFREQWGVDDLVCYDEASVEGLSIPDFSKRFLVEAGLPRQLFISPRVRYRTYRDLPLLGKVIGDDHRLPSEVVLYRVFSVADYELLGLSNRFLNFYCLDEQVDGRVLTVDTEGQVQLWNTSVPQFAEFLLVIRQYNRWILRRNKEREQFDRPFTCDELDIMGAEVRQRLEETDPDACLIPAGQQHSAWGFYLLEQEVATGCEP